MTLAASRGRQTHCSIKGIFHHKMKTDIEEEKRR